MESDRTRSISRSRHIPTWSTPAWAALAVALLLAALLGDYVTGNGRPPC